MFYYLSFTICFIINFKLTGFVEHDTMLLHQFSGKQTKTDSVISLKSVVFIIIQ